MLNRCRLRRLRSPMILTHISLLSVARDLRAVKPRPELHKFLKGRPLPLEGNRPIIQGHMSRRLVNGPLNLEPPWAPIIEEGLFGPSFHPPLHSHDPLRSA